MNPLDVLVKQSSIIGQSFAVRDGRLHLTSCNNNISQHPCRRGHILDATVMSTFFNGIKYILEVETFILSSQTTIYWKKSQLIGSCYSTNRQLARYVGTVFRDRPPSTWSQIVFSATNGSAELNDPGLQNEVQSPLHNNNHTGY